MNTETNEAPEDQPADEYVAELIEGAEDQSGEQEVADVAAVEIPVAPVASSKPSVVYDPSVLVPVQTVAQKPPPSQFENLAAKGGAIGAIVLGVLSFVGSFITSYAILNSFMGVLLGLWGLRSNHQKTALIGILLCLISAFFCVVEISAWIQSLWPQEEF